MGRKIPIPSITRLNLIYSLLQRKEAMGIQTIYSAEIGKELGVAAHNVRKDISCLGEIGNTNAGYTVSRLKEHIRRHLKLNKERKVCLVGLGRLGSAFLNYEPLRSDGCRLVAGFDRNINTLEITRTDIPLYPAYEITEVVRQQAIEQAIIAVPAEGAQAVADNLIAGGIKGILNFAPVLLNAGDTKVIIRNFDLLGELRLVSAILTAEEPDQKI